MIPPLQNAHKFDPNFTGPVDSREPFLFPYIRHLHEAVHVQSRSMLRKKLHAVFHTDGNAA